MEYRITPLRLAALTACTVLALTGLSACGSSGSTNTATATTATANTATATPAAFCTAWVATDKVASGGPDSGEQGPTPAQVIAFAKQLQPLIADTAKQAPDDIAGPVDDVKTLIDDAATDTTGAAGQKLDPSSPTLGVPLNKIEAWTFDNCGFTRIDAMGMDYAFDGVPEKVEAGNASVRFKNMSKTEQHEMAFMRINDGADLTQAQLVAALKKNTNAAETKYGSDVTFVADVSADAGKTNYVTVDLKTGNYVIACFVPQGGADGGTPHTQLGMVTALTVS